MIEEYIKMVLKSIPIRVTINANSIYSGLKNTLKCFEKSKILFGKQWMLFLNLENHLEETMCATFEPIVDYKENIFLKN